MPEPDQIGAGEPESTVSTRLWFAVRVKSNFERTTVAVLNGKGYATYLPTYRQPRRWSDRTNITELPLFPGYVFAQFDVDRRLPILTTPGVVHIVPPRQVPVAVDAAELDSVRMLVNSGLPMGPHPFLRVGQRVAIRRGSMTGLEGILVQVKGTFRLVVSVTLMQRSVAVEIDREWVSPVGAASPPGHRSGEPGQK